MYPHPPNTTQIPEPGGLSHRKQPLLVCTLSASCLLSHCLTPSGIRCHVPGPRGKEQSQVCPWLPPLLRGFSSFRTALTTQPAASLGPDPPGEDRKAALAFLASRQHRPVSESVDVPALRRELPRAQTSHCWFPHSLRAPSEEAMQGPIPLSHKGEHGPSRMPNGGRAGGGVHNLLLSPVSGGKRA